jgi:pantothenate kinase-related protein Tda10
VERKRQLIHLVEAEAHVAGAWRHIARQEEIIAAFKMRGHDAKQAEDVLVTFMQSLRLHEQHLTTIRHELWAGE